jgi:hypothetical protein
MRPGERALALGLLLVGCSGNVETDGGVDGSVTSALDGSVLDSGGFDAGAPDAGAPDAGTPDAGEVDSGRPDAGMLDAGVPVDAGCLQMELDDGGCEPLSFARVCALKRYSVLQSGVLLDDLAGARMGQALMASCNPAPVSFVPDGGALDARGAPLLGRGDALVGAGGTYTQPFVGWFEARGGAPVYDSSVGTLASFSSAAGTVLFSAQVATFGVSVDYFLLEFVRSEPMGPLAVVGYGFYAPGTTAAAWWFEHRVLPTPSASDAAWYVVRWTDLDGDGQPGAADEFLVLGSGR